MPSTMDDVNEMRELAAGACGEASRLNAQFEEATDDNAIIIYGIAMRDAGQYAQHAADIEAWVTLRMRIEALRDGGEYWDEGNGAVNAVLAIMDELEES